MLIHKGSLPVITSISLHEYCRPSLARRFVSVDFSTSSQTGTPTASTDEESHQFNEKLIRRIKKSQLFRVERSGVWQQGARQPSRQPPTSLPADLQKYLPSVSKIISETMTEENAKVLEIWKARMIKKLGWSEFQKYQNETLSRGKRLHKNIEYKLKQQEENIKLDEDLDGYWTSMKPILAEVNDVHLIEERLTHPNLLYKGIVDCVARLNRTTTVVDWKTSEKVKDTLAKLYDAPVQTVAYLGALNQSDLLDFEIDQVAVVVAYGDGRVANYHQLKEPDCERFWMDWTKKVEQYWIRILSSSPADPGLLAHFDDLLAASEEKNRKVYQLGDPKEKKKVTTDSLDVQESSSGSSSKARSGSKDRLGGQENARASDQASKNHKTKDELIGLIQKRRKD